MKEYIRKFILISCLILFVYSIFQLGSIWWNYHKIETETEELIEEVVHDENTADPTKRQINFNKLLKKNPDVIGWLYIPDTNIDEPILKGKNNNSYIRTDIYKKYNSAGAIFIDQNNHGDFLDDNTIIYGHNMMNGSRFHNLRYYYRSQKFYKNHQNIYIYLPDGSVNVYNVCCINLLNASSSLYQTVLGDYSKYIEDLLKKATNNTRNILYEEDDETLLPEQPMIMLSTCYDTSSSKRYVVSAKLDSHLSLEERIEE